MNGHSFLSALA